MTFPYPRHDLPVVETDDQLHVHRHFAAQPFDDSNDVGILTARRHEIDQANRAALGFNLRLEDERVAPIPATRSEEHTSELQSRFDLVCRLLLEKKNRGHNNYLRMMDDDSLALH